MKLFAAFSALIIALALGFALALLMAYPTLWLVNFLFTAQSLTYVFGAAKITFWQAFCLNMLSGWLSHSGSRNSSKD